MAKAWLSDAAHLLLWHRHQPQRVAKVWSKLLDDPSRLEQSRSCQCNRLLVPLSGRAIGTKLELGTENWLCWVGALQWERVTASESRFAPTAPTAFCRSAVCTKGCVDTQHRNRHPTESRLARCADGSSGTRRMLRPSRRARPFCGRVPAKLKLQLQCRFQKGADCCTGMTSLRTSGIDAPLRQQTRSASVSFGPSVDSGLALHSLSAPTSRP